MTALSHGLRGELVAPAPTTKRARARWLAARQGALGATDVGVVLGLSQWGTPLGLYLEKTGEGSDDDPTEVMEWGLEHEGTIARVFARRHAKELGVHVAPSPGLVRHEEFPWLTCTPDRILVDRETKSTAVAALEIKTAGHYVIYEWDEGVPLRYEVQVIVQMGILGLRRAYVVPLFGGNRMPRPYVVDWDQAVWDRIVEITGDWWHRHVEQRVPPEPLLADSARLPLIWPGGEPPLALDDEHAALVEQRRVLRAEADALKDEIDAIDLRLKRWMGDARGAAGPDGVQLVTWSRFDKDEFDMKAFRADHPEMAASYTNRKPSQRFVVKKKGPNDE